MNCNFFARCVYRFTFWHLKAQNTIFKRCFNVIIAYLSAEIKTTYLLSIAPLTTNDFITFLVFFHRRTLGLNVQNPLLKRYINVFLFNTRKINMNVKRVFFLGDITRRQKRHIPCTILRSKWVA